MLQTLSTSDLLEAYCLQGPVSDLCCEDQQVVTGEEGVGLYKERAAENTLGRYKELKAIQFYCRIRHRKAQSYS